MLTSVAHSELEGENYLLSGALTTFALPALLSALVIATDQ